MAAATALTANEAAVVTRVPLKQVHRIIDAGMLPMRKGRAAGERLIQSRSLVALRLAYLTADTLTVQARRQIVKRAMRDSESDIVLDSIAVRVQPVAMEVRQGLIALEKARSAVSVDKDIMGGAPCIRGTRIPVHMLADMVAQGDHRGATLAAYPQLTAEQVELAVLYAAAYPRRGRPPARQPGWLRHAPRTTKTVRLDDLPTP